ncbi:hypothetical protein L207DRAFT_574684 [Hyaloscypha variabilis F]|uniref:Uncharacterized protein n=1 Tax=Hyaloscypha variabilis (strain UAMH 11265 / GT02V1 / F) TaxID=1149755 RepID=A0A2J6QR70_HYAVF|nr:hypothetical protein L207DRAFT_574684 [Hyaloscypha variabilis F]
MGRILMGSAKWVRRSARGSICGSAKSVAKHGKSRCSPAERTWAQKCDRCIAHRPYPLPSSESELNTRKRGTNLRSKTPSTSEDIEILRRVRESSTLKAIKTESSAWPEAVPEPDQPSPAGKEGTKHPASAYLPLGEGEFWVSRLAPSGRERPKEQDYEAISYVWAGDEKIRQTPIDTKLKEPPRIHSDGIIVKQRGIKVLIKNREDSAFGDTGAGQNVISDRRRKELGLQMQPNPKSFPMGNSKRIFSPGTVTVPLAFEDDPTNIMTIVAHVVYTFAYDLLLGNPFLKATKCLTTFIHRFVPCLFSVKSKWSFNLLGETTQRFKAQLGNGILISGLPDIGSARNVMDARLAIDYKDDFEILSQPENCGKILFPDGTEEATIGQARTTITLADGKVVPIVFELLPDCHVPVVLGQDFVFDYDIYRKYATSIMESDDLDGGDELMPMGFRMNTSSSQKSKLSKSRTTPATVQNDDLQRQLEWNLKYQCGRIALIDEWNLEDARREAYARLRNPNWQRDPNRPLIPYKPKVICQSPGTTLSTQSPTTQSSSGANLEENQSSDSSSSFHSRDSTLRDSSDVFSTTLDNPSPGWEDVRLSDSFGSDEAAQWQAERPI